MGRRSDHSRAELAELMVDAGHAHLAEAGFARFSAREVAKRVGYSVGTLYNVFGTIDRLMIMINGRTFELWADELEARLASGCADRIASLVFAYFDFARRNANLWMAIYDHRLPEGAALAPDQLEPRTRLVHIVAREVAAVLPPVRQGEALQLARSLIATVHGHCTFALNGSFALMGELDPEGLALARVRESLTAA
jgi:AcrR family transcriptional regulator